MNRDPQKQRASTVETAVDLLDHQGSVAARLRQES